MRIHFDTLRIVITKKLSHFKIYCFNRRKSVKTLHLTLSIVRAKLKLVLLSMKTLGEIQKTKVIKKDSQKIS